MEELRRQWMSWAIASYAIGGFVGFVFLSHLAFAYPQIRVGAFLLLLLITIVGMGTGALKIVGAAAGDEDGAEIQIGGIAISVTAFGGVVLLLSLVLGWWTA